MKPRDAASVWPLWSGRFLRALTIACLTGVALVAVACGGGDGDSSATATPAANEAASATATPATSSTGSTPRPAASTTASPGTASLTGRLPDLNSYRYILRIEGTAGLIAELSGSALPAGVNPNTGTLVFEAKGAYVKPDRGESTLSFGGLSIMQVTIARQQWTTVGGLVQGPTPLTSPSEDDYSFVATFWDTSPAEALRGFACGSGRETANGISTRKCTADRATVERLDREGKLFTTGTLDLQQFSTATVETWVTDGDKVIRFRANMAGRDTSNRDVALKLDVDISDINTNITINPPR